MILFFVCGLLIIFAWVVDDLKNMPLDEALSLINDYYENPPLTEFHITQRHLSTEFLGNKVVELDEIKD